MKLEWSKCSDGVGFETRTGRVHLVTRPGQVGTRDVYSTAFGGGYVALQQAYVSDAVEAMELCERLTRETLMAIGGALLRDAKSE